MNIGRFPILLLFIFLFVVASQAISASAGEREFEPVANEDVIWTMWDSTIFTLVDDGDVMWIGSGAGLVQLVKGSGKHRRWSTPDGLPHFRVFTGALDGDGVRWFGGDGGLSKLDAGGGWTHYDSANSGLFNDVVQGIAVSAGGDIWTSHTGSAKISRLRPDGSWLLYPNRETAVSLAYEAIKQTINENDLWTVAGDEVWIGYDVYDGTQWLERRPARATMDPRATRADSENHVWALDVDYVFEWDGAQWETYYYSPTINGELHSLTVDENDVVWAGGYENYDYYFWNFEAAVGSLPEEPGNFNLDQAILSASPTAILLPTAEGLWKAGRSNWVSQPGKPLYPDPLHRFEDVPYHATARKVLLNNEGGVWIHSGDYGGDAIQTLDDRGTATTQDDSGEIFFEPQHVTALELAGNGDLWVATTAYGRFFQPFTPTRIHKGRLIDYWMPIDNTRIREIFAEDATHTWFSYEETDLYGDAQAAGLWSLDDGGTPVDRSDDVWTTYDTGDLWGGIPAARDGKLWLGTSSGVYQYHEDGWEQISSQEVKSLIPAKDGVLFVDEGEYKVLVIEANGEKSWRYVTDLIEKDLPLVRSTTTPNALWHVAPDGVVWYWYKEIGYYDRELASYDGQTLRTYESPLQEGVITVDEYNHLWLTGEGNMWRMSATPGFQLSTGPATWFMEANESRDFAVAVLPVEGFMEPVALSVNGLPAGVTAEVQPSEVLPGETAVVTLTSSGASLGKRTITIHGASGELLREDKVTLAVVEEAHGMWLPAVFNSH